jgi:hypothetical protein
LTVALALPPAMDAVTTLVPAAIAATDIGTLVWPEANATVAGTLATPVFELTTLRVPAAVGVGESVAVRLPLDPNEIVSGLGESDVGLTRFGVAKTVTVMTVLAFPATWSE